MKMEFIQSSSAESESAEAVAAKKKKYAKKKNTTKTFQESWFDDEIFKNWVIKTEDKTTAKCKVCNKVIQCGKSELIKHSEGAKHKKRMRSITNVCPLNVAVKEDKHQRLVKKAEIKLCAFFAEHNVAINCIDHLTPLLKDCFPDSKILTDVQLKRTKCTEMLNNVLGRTETNWTINDLKQNKFAILVDESTDISTKKNLCVLVRYFKENKIVTKLLELIKIDATNASAKNLYKAFKECLTEKGIPVTNIIGIASDGCSTMVGNTNSFFTHLREDVPQVILMSCICHSAALIASKACEELPRSPEDLMRSIYAYVSGSAKRCAQLVEIQEYFKIEQKKILKLATTRWLSRHACVVRILENYTVLEHFFRIAVVEDKLKSADTILADLTNIYNKAYLLFLKFVLNIFNSFNAIFQSRDIQIHKLISRCNMVLKQLCQNFLKTEIIMENKIEKLNVKHPHYFLPLKKVYLGQECEELVKQMPHDGAEDFRRKCLNFYVTAAFEMQKRFPLENELFEAMQFLDPAVAFFANIREERNVDISKLVNYFCDYIDPNEIELEWRNLLITFDKNQLDKLINMPLDEMWHYISQIKDFDDHYQFKNICNLANLILILPHSNAEAERIFSIVSDVKSKKRNKIGEELLNSVCIFRSALQASQKSCVNFVVEKEHIDLHNTYMYSFKNSTTVSASESGNKK